MCQAHSVESILLDHLREIAERGSPAQAAAAAGLLRSPSALDEAAARDLIDAYLHDPHLTR